VIPFSGPVLRAPEEDEAVSEEERVALREAEQDVREGRVRELGEVLAGREE
jgi:hypothetical protein